MLCLCPCEGRFWGGGVTGTLCVFEAKLNIANNNNNDKKKFATAIQCCGRRKAGEVADPHRSARGKEVDRHLCLCASALWESGEAWPN